MENTWYLDHTILWKDLGWDRKKAYEDFADTYPIESKDFTKTLGKFRVEYTNYNHHKYILYRPYPKTSINSKLRYNHKLPSDRNAKIKFYEDDVLIKELDQIYENPCIILDGDGQTRKGTKFTLLNEYKTSSYHYENQWIEVYNFEFELIRRTLPLPLEDLFETNHDYFLTIADVMQNDAHENPHLGIVKRSEFFADDGNQEKVRSYDNARVGLPTDSYGEALCPVKLTKDKMILSNGKELDYSEVMDFDFDPEDEYNTAVDNALQSLGLPAGIMKNINDVVENQLIQTGSVCINLENFKKT